MKALHGIIKECAAVIAGEKFTVHDIKISFSAPNPKVGSAETLTVEKEKKFEANFQWLRYAILFTDSAMKWYGYITSLNAWGTKLPGDQQVFNSDSKGKQYKDESAPFSVEEIERALSKYLKEPDLHPKAQVIYINGHKSDKGHEYSSDEFKKFFNNDFYVVISKNKELVNPFGKPVGKAP
jgi:hypothetical protein